MEICSCTLVVRTDGWRVPMGDSFEAETAQEKQVRQID